MKYYIYCDGGTSNNQTPEFRRAYYSYKIYDNDRNVIDEKYQEPLGTQTNNEAEYLALIMALEKIPDSVEEITVYSDSQLVVNQLNGTFAIKKPYLRELVQRVKDYQISKKIPIFLLWTPRENIMKELGH